MIRDMWGRYSAHVHRIAERGALLYGLTVAVAAGHAAMIPLHMVGRAAPAIPPTHPSPAIAQVSAVWWVAVHAVTVALLGGAVVSRRWWLGMLGGALSAVVWLSWALLLLVWSLDTVPPVSLVAPVLILATVAPVSGVVFAAWTERDLTA